MRNGHGQRRRKFRPDGSRYIAIANGNRPPRRASATPVPYGSPARNDSRQPRHRPHRKIDTAAQDDEDHSHCYHEMVNWHGATIPRGQQRRRPHMVGYEGVGGAEYYQTFNEEGIISATRTHRRTRSTIQPSYSRET